MLKFFFLLIFFSPISLKAFNICEASVSKDDSLDLIVKIDRFIDQGKLDSAIIEYRSFKRKFGFTSYQSLKLASCFAQLDMNDSSFYYLNLLLKINPHYSDLVTLYKSDLYFLIEDKRWEEFLSRIKENHFEENGKILNRDYANALIDLGIKDRAFYYHVYLEEEREGPRSAISLAIWELKKKINEENIIVLERLISKYGWPKQREVGLHATTAFFIIQHNTLEVQKKYLPLIRIAYENNEAPFNWIAMIEDRILLREHKPQKYGSQNIWNPKLNRHVLYNS